MASIEDADEFAEWLFNLAKGNAGDAMRLLRRHFEGRGLSARRDISVDAELIRGEMAESRGDGGHRPLDSAEADTVGGWVFDPEGWGIDDPPPPGGAGAPAVAWDPSQALPNGAVGCYATSLEEAGMVAAMLRAEQVPYCIDMADGLYCVSADERALSAASPALREMAEAHSIESVEGLLAVDAACALSAPDIAQLDFIPGARENTAFLFETVSWDREGGIVADRLDELGVPFARQRVGDDLVRFEVAPEHAWDVREVARALSESTKGLSMERFSFSDGFSQAAESGAPEREVFRTRGLTAEEAHAIESKLQSMGIEYDAVYDQELAATFITMDSGQCARAMSAMDALTGKEPPVPGLSETKQLRRAYAEQTAPATERAREGLEQATRTQKAAERARAARTTPVRDEELAREASKSQGGRSESKKRKPNQSRGQAAK